MNPKGLILVAILISILASPLVLITQSTTVGIHQDFPHARVVVTNVVDGDTIHIAPAVCVAGSYRTVVRLADIQAPELDQPGGVAARDALIGLLAQYNNIVYLDIANYSISQGCSSGLVDGYGRIIAVAYVRVNDTHLLNVNKWLIDNNYASIVDFTNDDFDPSKWSLYTHYEIQKERLPSIKKTTLFTGFIQNATSWGVRVATTLDGKYLGVAFAEGAAGNWTLNVMVLDNDGNIVNHYRYGPDKGSAWYANVFRGMLDIAGNETGFLVTWTNFTRAGTARVVLFSYVPVNGTPTLPSHIFVAGYQYHPTVTYFIHANGTKWWVIGYGRQTGTSTNYTLNLLDLTPAYTGRFVHTILAGGATTSEATTPRVGVDIQGGLIYDPATANFTIITRVNKSRAVNVQGGPVDHDLLAVVGRSHDTLGFFLSWRELDTRPTDQGPEPDVYLATGVYYTYFNLYPSIFSKLLGSGRYVLTVYNESATALSYLIMDLQPTTAAIVSHGVIINRPYATTYYPWIASSDSNWFVAWSAGGWVNASIITTSGIQESFVIADFSSSYVRVAYDPGSGKYIIPFGVTDETGYRNLFVAFYDTSTGRLEPWILPVATIKGQHETPLHVAVLSGPQPGSPGRIAIVALEGGSLVVYLISETYPELQTPIPIPEPWFIAVAVFVVALVASYFVILRRKVSL